MAIFNSYVKLPEGMAGETEKRTEEFSIQISLIITEQVGWWLERLLSLYLHIAYHITELYSLARIGT